jgi:hypothetical protein
MNHTGLVRVVHLSDVHFGDDHCFDPERTPRGDRPSRAGWPELAEKLEEDLAGDDPGFPVIVCITGDIAHTADPTEYERAKAFIRHLRRIRIFGAEGRSIFMVPGNHDVVYGEPEFVKRSLPFINFYNDIFGTDLDPRNPYDLVQLHDRVDDLGVMVLSLHSAMYVEKDKADQDRGQLDQVQLRIATQRLQNVDPPRLASAIRIALIHHHPVLIPPLVEPKRQYDAVLYAGDLLNLLRTHGFHLILHGHKHYPYNFTYDARSAFHGEPVGGNGPGEDRLVIVAGGSVGSRGIPDLGMKCNCYNQITLRWNQEFGHVRVRIETRRLRTRGDRNAQLAPWEWSWDKLDEDDRSYSRAKGADAGIPPVKVTNVVPFEQAGFEEHERARVARYQEARGNMAVVEVMPSLVRGQDKYFEARTWIVPHGERALPLRVTWSAGPKFEKVVRVTREEDENFSAAFYYFGPMLIQGVIEFDDGASSSVYVYARVPKSYE